MAESLRCKVEEHLTCSVCLEPFEDPKVLPCLHSYCHGCIVNLTKSAETNTINCPECRLVVEVDENTVSALPSNFFVNNLLATMTLTNDKPTAKTIVCDSCDSEDAAQSRCNDCGIFLCQYCTDFHKRSRSLKHHKLLTMNELKSNPGPQSIAEKIRCPKHKDEVIKLFCETCQTTICRDCIIIDHRQHEYGFVEEVAVKEKEKINVSLNEVKQKKDRVVQGIETLKKLCEGLEVKKKSTITEVTEHFHELLKATESRKNEMVEKATALTNAKQKQIEAQMEVLEVALASCNSSIEFTEQAFKSGNDVQILSMEKYILQSLEQLKIVKDQTKPFVTKDMGFVIPPSAQKTSEKLLNEYDVDVTAVNPENCQAAFGCEENMFIAQNLYSVTLICQDKENQRLRYGSQDIQSLFSGVEVCDVSTIDNKDGSFIINFRPRRGGILKFEVSINGIPAPNCSLTKQVTWVISNAYGKGVITHGGRTMKGISVRQGKKRLAKYCWRLGGCNFESGVHMWAVEMFKSGGSCTEAEAEVGIIDNNEMNGVTNKTISNRKWVVKHYPGWGCTAQIYFTLDMGKKSLKVLIDTTNQCWAQDFEFTAHDVSPFFSCSTPNVSISLME